MLTGHTKQSVLTFPGAGSARTSVWENGGGKNSPIVVVFPIARCALYSAVQILLAPTVSSHLAAGIEEAHPSLSCNARIVDAEAPLLWISRL